MKIMTVTSIAAIVIAGLLSLSAPAFAAGEDGSRVLKVKDRQTVWVEQGEKAQKAPYALTGQEQRATRSDDGLERQNFGRAGYQIR